MIKIQIYEVGEVDRMKYQNKVHFFEKNYKIYLNFV